VQTRTEGSEIDYGAVKIGGAAPTATDELMRQTQAGPFGDSYTVDYWFEWILPGNAASYAIDLPASGASMSFDRVAVDTLATLGGDVNRDGTVNGLDVSAIASAWLTSGPIGSVSGDANFDGSVNGLDISLIAAHWLYSTGAGQAAAVPEPSAGLLLAAGASLLVASRALRKQRSVKAAASQTFLDL